MKNNSKLNYLNVGCGKRYHVDWVNIDILPADPGIIHVDGKNGFPFPDKSMDVVYHSHVLEHISCEHVSGFIRECHRVLKENGIIRVVVPDLEAIARNYLKYLEESMNSGSATSIANYNWSIIELLDQLVRERSGGEMLRYLEGNVPNRDFVISRNGEEVRPYLDKTKKKTSPGEKFQKFWRMTTSAKWFFLKKVTRQMATKIMPWNKLFQVGEFRAGGEVHKWMYDRLSLKLLLESSGFEEVEVKDAFTSAITNWQQFELDGKNGEIFKPDSIFIEARKRS